MKDPILYMIQSIVCSGLFLAIYRLLVMQSTGFRVNRIFLLLAMIGACAIPWLQIPVWTVHEPIMDLPLYENMDGTTDVLLGANRLTVRWGIVIYVLGVVIMLIRMFMPLFRAMTLKRKEKVILQGSYFLVICKDIQDAFSSFRTIYLPMIDDKEEERMVIAHEESHLRHFHIFERWTMELLKAFCWFNPFVWMASRYLVESQELEVDADVLHQGFDLTEYRKMLLKYAMGGEREWICAFSSHFMKRRLLAMTECRKVQNIRGLLIIPLFVIAIVFFCFTIKPVELENNVEAVLQEPTEVVIKGKVIDDKTGYPINGASVIEAGRTNGTIANKYGEFQLKTSKGRVLQFAMIGYDTRQFKIEELMDSNVEIRMKKH